MKILVADDGAISRRLLEKTLLRAGHDVVAVQNGLAAAGLCKQDGPRLALLDWEMPELDGPAVCREVRKKKGQGYDDFADLQRIKTGYRNRFGFRRRRLLNQAV